MRKKIARVHAVNVCMSSKNHQFRHRQVILQKYELGIIFCASLYRIGSATRIRSYDQPVNGFKGTVSREKGDRPAAEFFFHMRRCLRPKQLSPNISAILRRRAIIFYNGSLTKLYINLVYSLMIIRNFKTHAILKCITTVYTKSDNRCKNVFSLTNRVYFIIKV